MRPVVHSTKHYIQMTLSTVLTVSRVTNTLATAVQSTVANLASEIEEGAIVKAVYIELWVEGTVQDQFFTIVLDKATGGASQITFAQMTDLFTYANKKNIFYVTQGIASNDAVSGPVPVIRQWFKIPKTKQRFGLGDTLTLSIASRGLDDIKFCGFATYKEYT